MALDAVSLVSGTTPEIIVALGLSALALSLRCKDGVWKQQLLIGLPLAGAAIGIAALLVDGVALIPYQFPRSYYVWVGLVFLSMIFGVIGWLRFRHWKRVASVLSFALTALMGFTLINQHYQYYPTLGSIFGVEAKHQVSVAALGAARARLEQERDGGLPTHGFTTEVPIPGRISGFQPRSAFIWLPPIWVADTKVRLPVIELLHGTPGAPSDWTRASFADRTARAFADAHQGLAPIIVMPDINGSVDDDTECVNSPRGQAETYLTVDVPNFVRTHYNAETTPETTAIAGLSEGGMCSIMLALRHPDVFHTFGDYSGLESPTPTEVVDPDAAIPALFGGSATAYQAHNPPTLLKQNLFKQLAGWFEVGRTDSAPLASQRTLVPLSIAAGVRTCRKEVPGAGHNFALWAMAFQDSLPWMSWRLGLTAQPATDAGAICVP